MGHEQLPKRRSREAARSALVRTTTTQSANLRSRAVGVEGQVAGRRLFIECAHRQPRSWRAWPGCWASSAHLMVSGEVGCWRRLWRVRHDQQLEMGDPSFGRGCLLRSKKMGAGKNNNPSSDRPLCCAGVLLGLLLFWSFSRVCRGGCSCQWFCAATSGWRSGAQ